MMTGITVRIVKLAGRNVFVMKKNQKIINEFLQAVYVNCWYCKKPVVHIKHFCSNCEKCKEFCECERKDNERGPTIKNE